MQGYITIDKGELRVRELDVYQGYYCGICKTIGRRMGQASRMTLSYDSVFLAMVLDALEEEMPEPKMEHCIVHHISKKPVIGDNLAIDFAADITILLAYHKMRDDWEDERKLSSKLAMTILRGAYKSLEKKLPSLSRNIALDLKELSNLERDKSSSLDRFSECFGRIMGNVFGLGYLEVMELGCEITLGDMKLPLARVFYEMGAFLGKWIYTIDALDDYREDMEKDRYNPLIYRHPYGMQLKDIEKYREVLYSYMGGVLQAYDLLPLKKNKEILDNILLLGMRQNADRIIEKLKEGTESHE